MAKVNFLAGLVFGSTITMAGMMVSPEPPKPIPCTVNDKLLEQNRKTQQAIEVAIAKMPNDQQKVIDLTRELEFKGGLLDAQRDKFETTNRELADKVMVLKDSNETLQKRLQGCEKKS